MKILYFTKQNHTASDIVKPFVDGVAQYLNAPVLLIDVESETGRKLGVSKIPTLVVFDNENREIIRAENDIDIRALTQTISRKIKQQLTPSVPTPHNWLLPALLAGATVLVAGGIAYNRYRRQQRCICDNE